MTWETLDKEAAKAFIESVADNDHPILFEPSICDVYALPLDFYDGYSLYRIANKYTIPYLQLDYLSNGEDHYYLDGSENPFHNLNARGAISLDSENVYYYLSLYISYVYERGNSLSELAPREDTTIRHNQATQLYEVETTLHYQDATVQSYIEISAAGAIHVRTPVTVSFLEKPQIQADTTIHHPHAEKIIERSKTLLSNTKRGAELLALYNEKQPNIHVINSPNYQGFCTNTHVIYMCMPSAEQTAKYLQSLVLAGSIRDMQQIDDMITHPHPTEREDVYGDVTLAKNLDMVIEMCKIVEELEALNMPEGLHDFSKMGFAGLYQSYKTGSSEDALFEVYMSALKQQNIVE